MKYINVILLIFFVMFSQALLFSEEVQPAPEQNKSEITEPDKAEKKSNITGETKEEPFSKEVQPETEKNKTEITETIKPEEKSTVTGEKKQGPSQGDLLASLLATRSSERVNGVEVMVIPSVSIYSNTAGFRIDAGALTNLGVFLPKINKHLQDFVFGASLFYAGGWADSTALNSTGLYIIMGYQLPLRRFIDKLPWYGDWRFIITLRNGYAFQWIHDSDNEVFAKSAYYFAPVVSADIRIPGTSTLHLGISTGFDMFITDVPERSVHLGIFASWRF